MTNQILTDLGWSTHFARQVPTDADEDIKPVRISAVHRTRLDGLSADGPVSLSPTIAAGLYAVGDWVLADGAAASGPLERLTEITRRAAGLESKPQLIAANVDTLAIVTSCNDDFNVARLERYLALASQAGCMPLIVLTKADTCDDPQDYVRRAEAISPMIVAVAVNATDPESAKTLEPWCKNGQTLALVGSSGVGKTTLQNHLTGTDEATQGVRVDDVKGRHTTTNRALRRTTAGGWMIDTPGMRELRLVDSAEGIEEVFSDITDLAAGCKFRDCAHQSEPGCAVRKAVEDGELDPARLERWRKLEAEDKHNSATVAEARSREKSREKMYNTGKARGKFKRNL